MASVAAPMRATESVSRVRRPMRSPMTPKATLPIGRATNPSANTVNARQLLSCCARLRKELTADVSGKVAVDREVEPLDYVANQSGERRPGCRLTRGDHALGQPSGLRRPRGRLVNHTHLGECDQSLSLALPAQFLGAMTLSA